MSEYAILSLITATAALASIVGSLGLDRVIYRFLPPAYSTGNKQDVSRILSLAFLFRTIATAIATVVMALWFVEWPRSELAFASLISLLFAYSVLATLTDLLTTSLNGFLLFESQSRITTASLVARLSIICIVGWHFGEISLTTSVWILIIGEIINIALLLTRFLNALRHHEWKSYGSTECISLTPIIENARSNYLSYLVGLPWQSSMIRLLCSHFIGTQELANLALLQTLADRGKAYLPTQLLRPAIEPLLVRRQQEYTEEQPIEINRILNILYGLNSIILTFAIFLTVADQGILLTWLTKGNIVLDAALPAAILLSLMLGSLTSGIWVSCNVNDQMDDLLRSYMLTTSIALPLMILFAATRHGALGVIAVSCLQGPLLLVSLRMKKCKAVVGMWRWADDVKLMLGATSFAIATSLFFSGDGVSVSSYAWRVIGATLTFVLLIYVVRPVTRNDILAMKSILP